MTVYITGKEQKKGGLIGKLGPAKKVSITLKNPTFIIGNQSAPSRYDFVESLIDKNLAEGKTVCYFSFEHKPEHAAALTESCQKHKVKMSFNWINSKEHTDTTLEKFKFPFNGIFYITYSADEPPATVGKQKADIIDFLYFTKQLYIKEDFAGEVLLVIDHFILDAIMEREFFYYYDNLPYMGVTPLIMGLPGKGNECVNLYKLGYNQLMFENDSPAARKFLENLTIGGKKAGLTADDVGLGRGDAIMVTAKTNKVKVFRGVEGK